ncbi:MAG: hypothetical protein JWO08_3383, partial [Verrucomicrobiaceae bacterium]|nr:hypothetical protein [Verrucomicrobiaceae bacterium]
MNILTESIFRYIMFIVIRFRFNSEKAAQAGAILLKANGGQMDNYIFIKMLYLADRQALRRWMEPITGDGSSSMQYGPVLSTIYDLTKGKGGRRDRQAWSPFINDRDSDTNSVSLKQDPGTEQLSPAEIRILECIFAEFRDFNWKQMRDYCHSTVRFPEYDDTVGTSSRPIEPCKLLE